MKAPPGFVLRKDHDALLRKITILEAETAATRIKTAAVLAILEEGVQALERLRREGGA